MKSMAARRYYRPLRADRTDLRAIRRWGRQHDLRQVRELQRHRRAVVGRGLCRAGYAFGNIPVVKENFTLVILGIIFVSILPGIIEFLRQRKH